MGGQAAARSAAGDIESAVKWYEDEEVLEYSEGTSAPCSPSKVGEMYRYLAARGDVFIVEIRSEGEWLPIGDASVTEDSTPIVIAVREFRSRGIGSIVLRLLIDHSRKKGMRRLVVKEGLESNVKAVKLYTDAGFVQTDRKFSSSMGGFVLSYEKIL